MIQKSYTFTVPGVPKGQARPRFARMGKFVRVYDTNEASCNKQAIAAFAMAAGVRPIDGPVAISISAVLPRPQRLCRKKDPAAEVPATCKPDCDNIAKAVCDALNGVAYADDSQISMCTVLKMYHAIGAVPKMEIEIKRMTP
jgi:Holliday junction resolvase RusA-like endonuclease